MTDPVAPQEPTHERIEREAWVERYHRGDLTADEEALFEDHFFTCSRCQEELEAARDFQEGLRDVVSRDAARAVGTGAAVGAAASTAWLRGMGPGRRWLWAAALFLLVALPGWWLLFREGEAAETQVAQRPPADRPPVEAPVDSDSVTATPATAPVFLLATLRGGDDDPATVISSAEASEPLHLAVDAVESDFGPVPDAYRVTLTDASGRTLFTRDGLQPNALDVLLLTLPGGYLPSGDHEMVVEGVTGGEAEEIGRYRFRVEGG